MNKQLILLLAFAITSPAFAQNNRGVPAQQLDVNASIRKVDSFANVNSIDGLRDGERLQFDDAKGLFYYHATATGTTENATSSGPGTEMYGPGASGSGDAGRVFRIYSGPVKPEWWGADPTGVSDSAAAIQTEIDFAESNDGMVEFGPYSYWFTQKLTVQSGITIRGKNTILLKDYDGVGMGFSNGADTVQLEGKLTVRGTGAYAGNGTVASTSANAHGVEIIGSRLRVNGQLRSENHIGDGFRISDASGNANKCRLRDLWSTNNNGKGIRCVGSTQDNQSVWEIGWYTQGNYAGGVHLDTDYTGRQWKGFIYNEDSTGDGASDGVYFGQLKSSELYIYSEEQSTSGSELVIDTNCLDLLIQDSRANETVNNASESCVTAVGGTTWTRGVSAGYGRFINPDLDDSSDTSTYSYFGASTTLIGEDVIHGNGGREIRAIDYGGSYQHNYVLDTNKTSDYVFGGNNESWVYSANGTAASPTTKAVTESIFKQFGFTYTGAAYHTTVEIDTPITSVGSGNKASADYVIKLTPVGASSREEKLRLKTDGVLEVDAVSVDSIKLLERSANPPAPAEGESVIWTSDGTGHGDDGDILMATTAGGVTNYSIIFDHSAGTSF